MTETQKKSGIVAGVNQNNKGYGIILQDDTQWYNGKGSCPVEKGDQVDFKYVENGQWKNIESIYKSEQPTQPEQPENTKQSGGGYFDTTKIKAFVHLSLQQLETQLNEFNLKNKVIATQPILLPDLYYDAIVYYK